jgi:hypothetical protein
MTILNKFEGSWEGKAVDTILTNFNDICVKHDILKFYKIEAIATAPNTYTIFIDVNGDVGLTLGSVVDDVLYSAVGDKFVFVDGILFHNYQEVGEFGTLNSNCILERLISSE